MKTDASVELLVFEVSGHNFSVPLALVEEVVPSSVITRIPNTPAFLLGLSAVRGKVMGVIDASRRYGLPPALNSYFMVCHVRGNVTAVTIDRPLPAGQLSFRELGATEVELLRSRCNVDPKFVQGGIELLENTDDSGSTRATGMRCLTVDPDLFVSDEMASRIGKAV